MELVHSPLSLDLHNFVPPQENVRRNLLRFHLVLADHPGTVLSLCKVLDRLVLPTISLSVYHHPRKHIAAQPAHIFLHWHIAESSSAELDLIFHDVFPQVPTHRDL